MIKIFSDKEEIAQLLEQLKEHSVTYSLCLNDFDVDKDLRENEYYLFHLSKLNSKLFQSVISIPISFSDNCFFVISDNKKLLHDIITKIGFQNVFNYPDYKVKLEIALIENGLRDVKKSTSAKVKTGKKFKNIIGNSPEIKKAKMLAETAVQNPDLNVLLVGESGTGKKLFAQSIHQAVYGSNSPFVDILCNSYSEVLMEAELFGHEKNAFEGAFVKKNGLFELAENGTIFFDGIDDISQNLQIKLLNVLDKKTVRRIGGLQEIPINIRVIASSNMNVNNLLGSNNFNEDLLFMLNAITIELAPLRERGEDILLLVDAFIKEFCKRYNKKGTLLDEKLETEIVNYPWPGNIRELRNAVERAVILSSSDRITTKQFDFSTPKSKMISKSKNEMTSKDIINLNINFKNADLESISALYANEVLNKLGGSKIKTAQLLNISRPKLDKLLKIYIPKK